MFVCLQVVFQDLPMPLDDGDKSRGRFLTPTVPHIVFSPSSQRPSRIGTRCGYRGHAPPVTTAYANRYIVSSWHAKVF